MRSCLIFVAVLAGCATEAQLPSLFTAEEQGCAQKATEYMKDRFPDAIVDAKGVPLIGTADGAYYAWAVVADRCMKARGVY
jgi:hypothetical protein